MPIRNSDGSPYTVSGSLAQFDPGNPELELFNLWDEEIIQIGGSPLFYYDLFINVNNIDDLYVESRDKVYSPCPVCLYGLYDPVPSQNMLGTFGIDSPTEMMFEFNYSFVLRTLGFPPKIGARIFTPQKRENWMVVQRNVEIYKLWGELRLQVMCIKFPESLTTGEGRVTQQQPDIKVNSIKDLSGINLAGGQPQVNPQTFPQPFPQATPQPFPQVIPQVIP